MGKLIEKRRASRRSAPSGIKTSSRVIVLTLTPAFANRNLKD
jgi:hypothetical protein